MQYISENKPITLYLGDIFTTEHEKKNNVVDNEKYTLMQHVIYNKYNDWNENKKMVRYVVPKLKRNTWEDNVDEMYITGYLIKYKINISNK